MEIAEFFNKGGPVMYLLVISSVAVFAIGVERFRFYSYAAHDSENFLRGLKSRLEQNNFEASVSFCRSEKNFLAAIAGAGLDAAAKGRDAELAMDAVYGEAAMNLRARLNYLSMIVTMAPLLGLLGTISGMIESFNIFNLQSGQPLAITGGIGEALIATATGLCVAIFALIVHTYFAQKLDELLEKFERVIAIVLGSLEENKNATP